MKNRKSIFITILSIIVIAGIGLYFLNFESSSNNKLSATDVLENADFNVENRTLNIYSFSSSSKSPEIYKEISIPVDIQQELIKAFENATFEKIESADIGGMDVNFRINMVLNTGFAMHIDTGDKAVVTLENDEMYRMVDDNNFFDILVKATKNKALTKY